LVNGLLNTIRTGGAVFGAFYNGSLVAFASVEKDFFGSENQYLQISYIHTSYGSRGMGIGKDLKQWDVWKLWSITPSWWIKNPVIVS